MSGGSLKPVIGYFVLVCVLAIAAVVSAKETSARGVVARRERAGASGESLAEVDNRPLATCSDLSERQVHVRTRLCVEL
jgi:hypothetical protein